MKMLLLALISMTIVDRVAVSVGNRVITASEIELRIRLTAFENGGQPAFDLASRKTAVERLIDQKLVEHEMDLGHYPHSAPVQSGPAPEAAELAKYRISSEDLSEDLSRQADLLNFLNLRFRADSPEHADAEMEQWLKEQRRQTKIVYIDRELAP